MTNTAPPSGTATRALRPFGDAGLLLDVDGTEVAQALAASLRVARLRGVIDVVPGMSSVLVVFDRGPDVTTPLASAELAAAGILPGGRPVADALSGALAQADGADDTSPAHHEIEVVFDGPDLVEVADQCALAPGAVVRALTAAELSVVLLGFSPGFAYLRGLDDVLASVARRPTPRTSVPAGAVAVAGGFAAVYPQATPGGWQLVGRSAVTLFDPSAEPFARLAPGDRVRFVAVDHLPGPGAVAGATPPVAEGRAAFDVVDPGLLTLVEDLGRRGVAHLGVPRAGAADADALWLANRLVGNPSGAAALEITGRGPTLRCREDGFVAAVGALGALRVDGRPVPVGAAVPVAAGQCLEVGVVTGGLRAVVALSGGVVAESLMGSRATDTLSWTGPARLCAGDVVCTGTGPLRPRGHLAYAPPAASGGWQLRVLPGPHLEWFEPGAFADLAAATFEVAGQSGRVGIRLVPERPIGRRVGELASTPMVVGAVQVPPDGAPVVLGPDHATLGGYPVLAVVIGADLSLLGRCAPGDRVRLVPVDVEEAAAAWRARRRHLDAAVVGRFPTVSGT